MPRSVCLRRMEGRREAEQRVLGSGNMKKTSQGDEAENNIPLIRLTGVDWREERSSGNTTIHGEAKRE